MPSLMATLGLNAGPFKTELIKAQSDAVRSGKVIREGLGDILMNKVPLLGGAASVGLYIESVISLADHIHELSKEYRVSTDTIQIWDKGAKKVGMTAEDIGNAFNRLKKAREAAITKDDVGGFGHFGIGMAELKDQALSTEDIMERMRASAASHPITDQEDVAGMELMGRSGARVLSAMNEIHNMGPIHLIKEEDIESIHEAEKRLKALNNEITIGFSMIGGVGLRILDRASAGAVGLMEWFSGRMSLNEARRILVSGDVEAPKFDLKGRPINGPTATPSNDPGGGNTYTLTKTVNLQKDAAEIKKLQAQLSERILQNQLKEMTVAERRVRLEEMIAEHKKKSIEFRYGTGDEKDALEEDLEVEKLRGELDGVKDTKAKHFRLARPDVNERQRIGAYAPSVELSAATAVVKSEGHLSAIRKGIDNLNKRVGRTKY